MRSKAFYPGVVVLAIVGAAIWLRYVQPSPTVNGPMSAATTQAQSQETTETSTARSRQSDSKQSAAAATIRSTRVMQARRSQQEKESTASVAGDSNASKSPSRKLSDSAKAADVSDAPKSTAEILAPFIEDNPAEVFLPDSVRNHAAVQSETVDPDWGPTASHAMRDYLESQLGDRFDIPVVDCRQDLCELEATGRLGGNSSDDVRDFERALNEMKQQPWWSTFQFDQNTGLAAVSADGRAIIVHFYSRK